MTSSHWNQIDFKKAYNILCAQVPGLNPQKSLTPTFCKVKKDEETLLHSHYEKEIFYVISGRGIFFINQDQLEVTAGELIHIPSHSPHQLKNFSEEDLVFISIYVPQEEVDINFTKVFITTAPPTPNGPLHLGHISGPYLVADILKRYYQQLNISVLHLSGTDDHQNYVEIKALKNQENINIFLNNRRSQILLGFEKNQIEVDHFQHPSQENLYQEQVKTFFNQARDRNIIETCEVSMPICNFCDHLLVDGLVEATCPHCLEPSSGCCENCGLVVMPAELKQISCSQCHRPADFKKMPVMTFDLKKNLHLLLQKSSFYKNLPQKMQNLLIYLGNFKNKKLLIAYPQFSKKQHGIKTPDEDQLIIHVWFEMAANYYYLSQQHTNKKTLWIHNCGIDNAFYYLFFIPALCLAVDKDINLPSQYLINDFLFLNGKKFSTSRNHAIWAHEHLFHSDLLRLYLLSHRPEYQTTNFEVTDYLYFEKKWKKKLALLKEKLDLEKNQYPLEQQSSNFNSNPRETFIQRWDKWLHDFHQCLLSMNKDFRYLSKLIEFMIDETLHQNLTPEELNMAQKNLRFCLSPLMPEFSRKMTKELL